MTDRGRRIVRNATLTVVALMAVAAIGGCVPYRYGHSDGGYRNQSDHHAPSRDDSRPFPDREQQR